MATPRALHVAVSGHYHATRRPDVHRMGQVLSRRLRDQLGLARGVPNVVRGNAHWCDAERAEAHYIPVSESATAQDLVPESRRSRPAS
jgi:hypothetical protein